MPALLCPFHLHSAAPPRPPFIDTQVLKAHLSELLPSARDSSPVSASQHSLSGAVQSRHGVVVVTGDILYTNHTNTDMYQCDRNAIEYIFFNLISHPKANREDMGE
ncbi:hypothetical protein WG66_016751 [Moniliophthora roreri]|nr:hypothetical protein WG66_016751 [Moniliophthora roreri]